MSTPAPQTDREISLINALADLAWILDCALPNDHPLRRAGGTDPLSEKLRRVEATFNAATRTTGPIICRDLAALERSTR